MGQILIRQLEDELIAELKRRAKANGRSAEAEARTALRAALKASQTATAPEQTKPRSLVELMGAGAKWGRSQEEIDAYIRQLRDEWR